MANRTDPTAKNIRGTNPQNLVEKILRSKIYQNTYWKEQCFGLTAETLVDKAMEIDHLGGTHGGNRKPAPFMCLVMKMLQIQPEKDIVVEFIKNEDYKYVRILGAFYLRLTGTDTDVYQYLEPLYNDYRKLRQKLADGRFSLTHVDEVIDELLTKDYACDIALPRIKKRWGLVDLISWLDYKRQLMKRIIIAGEVLQGKEKGIENATVIDTDPDSDSQSRSCMSYILFVVMHAFERSKLLFLFRDWDYDREHGRGRERERDRDRDRDRHRLREEKDYGHERERERDREGRERERRDRDRGRRRSRSRSRDRKERGGDYRKRHARSSASPRRRADGLEDGNTRDEPRKKKEKKEKKDDGTDHPDPEIAEQNRLRASLGLKPLRP
ncbi:hypothetical protein HHK36_022989 [Tetracentron sinense]|uniref:Pre-mRNA-splicing factor 38 n=1 Tax=Tetracentron sinense TaxID=13715 RepID=A0A834YSX6_TETSI|nr:hypothetical protein HHK36_022989 [Tetracentron sinense]